MLQPEFLQNSPNQDEMWSRQYLSEKKNIVIIHPNPIYEKRKKRKRGRKRIREIFARITINTYEWHIEREKNAGKSLKRGWQWPCDRRLAVKKHTARGFRSLLAWFFPILIPGAIIFFFPPPFFPTTTTTANHHHRKLSWSAKHFFPWIWMRADAWNEARGSSVESFLMTERNDSSNLMEEGRTTNPSNFSRRTFLTSRLISTYNTLFFFSMSSIVQLNS